MDAAAGIRTTDILRSRCDAGVRLHNTQFTTRSIKTLGSVSKADASTIDGVAFAIRGLHVVIVGAFKTEPKSKPIVTNCAKIETQTVATILRTP